MLQKPVNARDMALQSYKHAYQIEDTIVKSLIEITNTGIKERASHGKLTYECVVPPFIYGCPRFNRAYVADKLRQTYADQGFTVKGTGPVVTITWKPKPD